MLEENDCLLDESLAKEIAKNVGIIDILAHEFEDIIRNIFASDLIVFDCNYMGGYWMLIGYLADKLPFAGPDRVKLAIGKVKEAGISVFDARMGKLFTYHLEHPDMFKQAVDHFYRESEMVMKQYCSDLELKIQQIDAEKGFGVEPEFQDESEMFEVYLSRLTRGREIFKRKHEEFKQKS